MRRHLRRPSASTVIASLALVAALGGTSYAAATITGSDIKNSSLRGRDIKNGSLTGKDIRYSSVTTKDIKNGTLLAKDFRPGVLPDREGDSGGGPGAITYAFGETGDVPAGEEGYGEAVCPEDHVVTGGGVLSTASTSNADPPPPPPDPSPATAYTVNSSYPSSGDGTGEPGSSGWSAYIENNSAFVQFSDVFAICTPGATAFTAALKKSSAR